MLQIDGISVLLDGLDISHISSQGLVMGSMDDIRNLNELVLAVSRIPTGVPQL